MNQRDFRTNDSKDKHIHEFQMNFLSRESSQKHVQMQEGLLVESIRKESSKLLNKKQSSFKTKSKPNLVKPFNLMGEAAGQTEDISQNKFQFNFFSYLGEISLAYGLLIGICYLIKAANFPYFQILLTLGLMNSITPWSFSNLIMVIAAIIVIANYFLNVSVLSYPAIIICYLSVMMFNERNKEKIMIILVFVMEVAWGFGFLPGLYSAFDSNSKQAFYYLFPLFMLIIRVLVSIFFTAIKYTEPIFLQIPLFLMGLEYGVILTLRTNYIEYWYLMVFFTLQIINDRTQFVLRICISILQACRNNRQRRGGEETEDGSSPHAKRDISVLAAHASGYSCVNSFHIICLIYIFTQLPIYSSPYTFDTVLLAYTQEQWYIPLATWALATVYEIMCLIHQRKHKNRLLIGHTKNTVGYTILRAFMLTLGFWMFYLGLGVGNYIFYPQNTRATTA